MNDAEAGRMRQDLETIRQAAGLSLTFDRLDPWLALALAPAGAILAAWSYFGPAAHWRLGILPLLLPFFIACYRQARRLKSDPPSRRERSFEVAGAAIIAVGALAYLLGLKRLGYSLDLAAPTVVFVLGLLCVVVGISSRARRAALAGAAIMGLQLRTARTLHEPAPH